MAFLEELKFKVSADFKRLNNDLAELQKDVRTLNFGANLLVKDSIATARSKIENSFSRKPIELPITLDTKALGSISDDLEKALGKLKSETHSVSIQMDLDENSIRHVKDQVTDALDSIKDEATSKGGDIAVGLRVDSASLDRLNDQIRDAIATSKNDVDALNASDGLTVGLNLEQSSAQAVLSDVRDVLRRVQNEVTEFQDSENSKIKVLLSMPERDAQQNNTKELSSHFSEKLRKINERVKGRIWVKMALHSDTSEIEGAIESKLRKLENSVSDRVGVALKGFGEADTTISAPSLDDARFEASRDRFSQALKDFIAQAQDYLQNNPLSVGFQESEADLNDFRSKLTRNLQNIIDDIEATTHIDLDDVLKFPKNFQDQFTPQIEKAAKKLKKDLSVQFAENPTEVNVSIAIKQTKADRADLLKQINASVKDLTAAVTEKVRVRLDADTTSFVLPSPRVEDLEIDDWYETVKAKLQSLRLSLPIKISDDPSPIELGEKIADNLRAGVGELVLPYRFKEIGDRPGSDSLGELTIESKQLAEAITNVQELIDRLTVLKKNLTHTVKVNFTDAMSATVLKKLGEIEKRLDAVAAKTKLNVQLSLEDNVTGQLADIQQNINTSGGITVPVQVKGTSITQLIDDVEQLAEKIHQVGLNKTVFEEVLTIPASVIETTKTQVKRVVDAAAHELSALDAEITGTSEKGKKTKSRKKDIASSAMDLATALDSGGSKLAQAARVLGFATRTAVDATTSAVNATAEGLDKIADATAKRGKQFGDFISEKQDEAAKRQKDIEIAGKIRAEADQKRAEAERKNAEAATKNAIAQSKSEAELRIKEAAAESERVKEQAQVDADIARKNADAAAKQRVIEAEAIAKNAIAIAKNEAKIAADSAIALGKETRADIQAQQELSLARIKAESEQRENDLSASAARIREDMKAAAEVERLAMKEASRISIETAKETAKILNAAQAEEATRARANAKAESELAQAQAKASATTQAIVNKSAQELMAAAAILDSKIRNADQEMDIKAKESESKLEIARLQAFNKAMLEGEIARHKLSIENRNAEFELAQRRNNQDIETQRLINNANLEHRALEKKQLEAHRQAFIAFNNQQKIALAKADASNEKILADLAKLKAQTDAIDAESARKTAESDAKIADTQAKRASEIELANAKSAAEIKIASAVTLAKMARDEAAFQTQQDAIKAEKVAGLIAFQEEHAAKLKRADIEHVTKVFEIQQRQQSELQIREMNAAAGLLEYQATAAADRRRKDAEAAEKIENIKQRRATELAMAEAQASAGLQAFLDEAAVKRTQLAQTAEADRLRADLKRANADALAIEKEEHRHFVETMLATGKQRVLDAKAEAAIVAERLKSETAATIELAKAREKIRRDDEVAAKNATNAALLTAQRVRAMNEEAEEKLARLRESNAFKKIAEEQQLEADRLKLEQKLNEDLNDSNARRRLAEMKAAGQEYRSFLQTFAKIDQDAVTASKARMQAELTAVEARRRADELAIEKLNALREQSEDKIRRANEASITAMLNKAELHESTMAQKREAHGLKLAETRRKEIANEIRLQKKANEERAQRSAIHAKKLEKAQLDLAAAQEKALTTQAALQDSIIAKKEALLARETAFLSNQSNLAQARIDSIARAAETASKIKEEKLENDEARANRKAQEDAARKDRIATAKIEAEKARETFKYTIATFQAIKKAWDDTDKNLEEMRRKNAAAQEDILRKNRESEVKSAQFQQSAIQKRAETHQKFLRQELEQSKLAEVSLNRANEKKENQNTLELEKIRGLIEANDAASQKYADNETARFLKMAEAASKYFEQRAIASMDMEERAAKYAANEIAREAAAAERAERSFAQREKEALQILKLEEDLKIASEKFYALQEKRDADELKHMDQARQRVLDEARKQQALNTAVQKEADRTTDRLSANAIKAQKELDRTADRLENLERKRERAAQQDADRAERKAKALAKEEERAAKAAQKAADEAAKFFKIKVDIDDSAFNLIGKAIANLKSPINQMFDPFVEDLKYVKELWNDVAGPKKFAPKTSGQPNDNASASTVEMVEAERRRVAGLEKLIALKKQLQNFDSAKGATAADLPRQIASDIIAKLKALGSTRLQVNTDLDLTEARNTLKKFLSKEHIIKVAIDAKDLSMNFFRGLGGKGASAFNDGFQEAAAEIGQMIRTGVSGIGESINEFAKISAAAQTIQAARGQASAADLNAFKQASIDAAAASTQTMESIAEFSTQLGRSGLSINDIAASMGGLALAADSTGEDINKLGIIVAQAKGVYNLSTEELKKLSAAYAAAGTAASFGSIGFGSYTKTFNQYYKSNQQGLKGLQDSIKLQVLFAKVGTAASTAGTGVRQMLSQMAAPSEKAASAFESINNALVGANKAQIKFRDEVGNWRSQPQVVAEVGQAYRDLSKIIGEVDADALFKESFGIKGLDAIKSVARTSSAETQRLFDDLDKAINDPDRIKKILATLQTGVSGAKRLFSSAIESLQGSVGYGFETIADLVIRGAAGAIDAMSDPKLFESLRKVGNDALYEINNSLEVKLRLHEMQKGIEAFAKKAVDDLARIVQFFVDLTLHTPKGLKEFLQDLGSIGEKLDFLFKIKLDEAVRSSLNLVKENLNAIETILASGTQASKTKEGEVTNEGVLSSTFSAFGSVGADIMQIIADLERNFAAMIKKIFDDPYVKSLFANAERLISGISGSLETLSKAVGGIVGGSLAGLFNLLARILTPVMQVVTILGQLLAIGLKVVAMVIQLFNPTEDILANTEDGAATTDSLTRSLDSLSKSLDILLKAMDNGPKLLADLRLGISYTWKQLITLGGLLDRTNETPQKGGNALAPIQGSIRTTSTFFASFSANIITQSANTWLSVADTGNKALTSINQRIQASAQYISNSFATLRDYINSVSLSVAKNWNLAWSGVGSFMRSSLTYISTLFNWLKSQITAIAVGASVNFRSAWETTKAYMFALVQGIGNIFKSLFTAIIEQLKWIQQQFLAVVNNIRSWFGTVGDSLNKGVVNSLSGMLTRVREIRDAISGWLQPLRDAAQTMSNFASNTGSKARSFFSNIPGFADGGVLPGYSREDNVLALLRSGEGVLVPEAVQMLGGEKAIAAINKGAIQQFATGGVVGPGYTMARGDLQVAAVLSAIAKITKSFPALQKVIQDLQSSLKVKGLEQSAEGIARLGTELSKLSSSAYETVIKTAKNTVANFNGGGGSGGVEAGKKFLKAAKDSDWYLAAITAITEGLANSPQSQVDTLAAIGNRVQSGKWGGLRDTLLADGQFEATWRWNLDKVKSEADLRAKLKQLGYAADTYDKFLKAIDGGALRNAIDFIKGATDYRGNSSVTAPALPGDPRRNSDDNYYIPGGTNSASVSAGEAAKLLRLGQSLVSSGAGGRKNDPLFVATMERIFKKTETAVVNVPGSIEKLIETIDPAYRQTIKDILAGKIKVVDQATSEVLAQNLGNVFGQRSSGKTSRNYQLYNADGTTFNSYDRLRPHHDYQTKVNALGHTQAVADLTLVDKLTDAVRVAIPSMVKGIVTETGFDPGYGNYVAVKDAQGREAFISHMTSIAVKVGQAIERGQTIGVQGTTGRSSGEHLHIEAPEEVLRDYINELGKTGDIAQQSITVDSNKLRKELQRIADANTTFNDRLERVQDIKDNSEFNRAMAAIDSQISKLKEQQKDITNDQNIRKLQATLDSNNASLAALITKQKLDLESFQLSQKSAIDRAKAPNRDGSIDSVAVSELQKKQAIDLERKNIEQKEAKRKAELAVKNAKAALDAALAKTELGAEISDLQELERLKERIRAEELQGTELEAALDAAGIAGIELGNTLGDVAQEIGQLGSIFKEHGLNLQSAELKALETDYASFKAKTEAYNLRNKDPELLSFLYRKGLLRTGAIDVGESFLQHGRYTEELPGLDLGSSLSRRFDTDNIEQGPNLRTNRRARSSSGPQIIRLDTQGSGQFVHKQQLKQLEQKINSPEFWEHLLDLLRNDINFRTEFGFG